MDRKIETLCGRTVVRLRRYGGLRIVALTSLAAVLLMIAAPDRQQMIALAQDEESLFSRIERALKEKEPEWKLVQRDERKGAGHKYFAHGWTRGDEYMSTTTYQLMDTTDAVKSMAEFLRSPISVPVRQKEVPELGDEAYTIGESPYGKKGAGTLIVRRVNLMIRLDASSLETAKQFARHMLNEVDAVCGGARCEPMGPSEATAP